MALNTTTDPAGDKDRRHDSLQAAGEKLVERILTGGIDGAGSWKGARAVAEEVLAKAEDTEDAVDRIVAMHLRLLGITGFATGLGGFATMVVALPADVVSFYVLNARMVGAIAHLRGYDIDSEEVRTAILVSLLGASGAALLRDVGIQVGNKMAMAALRRLPGKILMDINRRVGFRLVTKFGTKGVINLVKAIPLMGAGVGAATNVAAASTIARHARKAYFPAVSGGATAGEAVGDTDDEAAGETSGDPT